MSSRALWTRDTRGVPGETVATGLDNPRGLVLLGDHKLAVAEAMGSLGWVGARGKSRVWVSQGFRREYHKAQAVKLAIIDAAYETCFLSHR